MVRDAFAAPRGYLPAWALTKAASVLISASDSWPLNAGIAPPPFVTCRWTVASSGLRLSRLGPVVPVDPTAFSVWQEPQFVSKSLPAAVFACGPLAPLTAAARMAPYLPGTAALAAT